MFRTTRFQNAFGFGRRTQWYYSDKHDDWSITNNVAYQRQSQGQFFGSTTYSTSFLFSQVPFCGDRSVIDGGYTITYNTRRQKTYADGTVVNWAAINGGNYGGWASKLYHVSDEYGSVPSNDGLASISTGICSYAYDSSATDGTCHSFAGSATTYNSSWQGYYDKSVMYENAFGWSYEADYNYLSYVVCPAADYSPE